MTPFKYQIVIYVYALMQLFTGDRMLWMLLFCSTVLVLPFKLRMNCKQSVCRVDCS